MKLFIKDDFIFNVKSALKSDYATNLKNAKDYEVYNAISKVLMKTISQYWESNINKKKKKEAYYLSSEYLMGRALGNNLFNLEIYKDVSDALSQIDIDLNKIENIEQDAGLGNGGLGRLAACFLDSSATHKYPLHGYGIRYEYGLFKQIFKNNFQEEKADNWLKFGDPWSIRRESLKKVIKFSDQTVYAIPYDTPIIGYRSNTINTLRLWKCEPIEEFNFELFNNQNYDLALKEKNEAENISRVLYPNDSRREGKILRLKQQYFFVSASIQDLIDSHLKTFDTLDNFSEFNSIQLNDTHPAVGIAEFIRILLSHNYDFSKALEITRETFSYTNHTILNEALEKWDLQLYKEFLPEIVKIIEKLNQKLIDELKSINYSDEKIYEMMIIYKNKIHMAHLAIFASKFVNGVAELHTKILKEKELKNWYKLYPEKFKNMTNGVTQRRWLYLSNPELSELITKTLGSNNWIKNLDELKKLEEFANDNDFINKFIEIKQTKKIQLKDYIFEKEKILIDENSNYSIQIKRLHEYKRQLLNALHILDLYYKIKNKEVTDYSPTTFIFGAKAFPGYTIAKAIIKFINEIKDLVNNDEEVNSIIKVVFVTNYNVTYAQKLFPAANISQQISTAGKEASGTGNMKFMINGAPTLGTLDGANVEIFEQAGLDNNYLFGLKEEQVNELRKNYDSKYYYNNVEGLKRVVDSLIDGTFDDNKTGLFKMLYDSLIEQNDYYMVLADFESYREAQNKISNDFKDKILWAKKSINNIANSSKFSSDRTIKQYSEEIWLIEQNDY